MGFKRVRIEELETKLSPNFLGMPLKQVEAIIEHKKTEEKIQISDLEIKNINLFNEDILEYSYDNRGDLKKFHGDGFISVFNHSKKDRIWDTRVKVSSVKNTNLNGDDVIIFGNLEPETNKKINYNIINPENLVNPMKITESINVLNFESERGENKLKEKSATDRVVDKIVDSQIKDIGAKLASEKEKFEEANAKVAEWTLKVEKLNTTIKKLTDTKDSYLKTKSIYRDMKLKKFSEIKKKKDISDYETSINEIKNQIKQEQDDIIKITEEYSEKEKYAKKEIEEEFDPQIKSVKSKIEAEKENLDNIIKNFNQWTDKKDNLEERIKTIKKETKDLSKTKVQSIKKEPKALSKTKVQSIKKEPKSLSKIKVKAKNKADETNTEEINKEYDLQIKNSEEKLAAEQKGLEEAIKNVGEWSTKKKESEKLLKNLQKELDSLNQTKTKTLDDKSKTLSKERKIKIKEQEKQIKIKEQEKINIQNISTKQSSSLQEIEEEYDPKIKEVNSKISIEEPKLAEANKNLKKWTNKKNQLDNYIKNVEKEYEALVQADPEARSIRLKRILGDEGFDQIHPSSGINTSELRKNHLLIFNKNNSIQISIILENDTNSSMENILLGKHFSEDFTNFKCKSSAISEVTIEKGNVIWKISEMKAGEIVELEITADIFPKEKKIIGTGNIQISYDYRDYLISGINIKDFSAYSHGMHAIRIKEKENEPNTWDCALYFRNNCELNMELRSILVLDKEKQKKYIDFNADDEKIIISPGNSYSTEKWEIYSEEEPKFYRKLDYSITHSINKKTSIFLKIEENVFDIVDTQLSKKFSLAEIKSFEEAKIENHINIKNTGSIGIEAISIEDVIPADFSPPLKISEIIVRNSSGNINLDDIKLKVIPEDDDPSKNHLIFLKINGNNSGHLINVNDFLEIKFSFNAIRPDYKVKYEFPLKVISYYSKFQEKTDDYFKISSALKSADLPQLKIIHKRRNLIIGKSIFPGRDINEFGISIIINNKSNIEINDIKITDTISKSFELISSNLEAEILESGDGDKNIITFTVDSIFPYQEKEIRYYLRNVSGEDIGYEELESYIFG